MRIYNISEAYNTGRFKKIGKHLIEKNGLAISINSQAANVFPALPSLVRFPTFMKVKNYHRSKFSNLSNWKEEA